MSMCYLSSRLEIQWADTERHLTSTIEHLSQIRSASDDFNKEFIRLIRSLEDFLHRELLQRLDGLTFPVRLDLLEHDIQAIVTDKQQLVQELIVRARSLQSTLPTDTVHVESLTEKIEQLTSLMASIEQFIANKSVV
jgi:hypothetical protein